jgi:hypothetical protein
VACSDAAHCPDDCGWRSIGDNLDVSGRIKRHGNVDTPSLWEEKEFLCVGVWDRVDEFGIWHIRSLGE